MLEGVIAEELLLPITVAPALFDLEVFPSAAVVLFGTGGIAPAVYADPEIVYSPSINLLGLAPQSVVTDADTIFASTSSLVDAIAPALFQSDDVIYSSTIVSRGILAPFLLVDADRFFSLQSGSTFVSAAVASDDNIPNPILQHGTTWRTLSASVVDADLFRRPDVSWPVVSAALLDADIFYTPDIPRRLLPSVIASDDVISSAGMGTKVLPGFVVDTDQFFNFSTTQISSPALWTDPDIFYVPAVLQPVTQTLTAGLVSDADVFFTPAFAQGLSAGLVTDSDTIFAADIAIVIVPPAFVNATTTSGNTGGTSLSSPLVSSRTTGNLLVALIQTQTGPKTFSVGGGWTIGGTQADATMSSAWAWRYVDGTEAAPVFSWTTSSACHTKMFQFNHVASTSAPGAFASTSATGTAVSQTGITTTLDNSLVLALLFARTQQTSVAGITLGSYSATGTSFSDSFLTDIGGRVAVTTSGSTSPTLTATLTVSSLWHSHLVEIKRA